MAKIDQYREVLRQTPDWDAFLLAESNLPGPRGNLELAHAAAREGTAQQFYRWAALAPEHGPQNTPGEFIAFCGVLGMGRLLAEGDRNGLQVLRQAASDPRWRIREAAATGLQTWGDADMPALLEEMDRWSRASFFEQRGAMAALCEPRLLTRPEIARRVLEILDGITTQLTAAPDRMAEGFEALRKALGYGWSVAVAALPGEGIPYLEKWAGSPNPDARWIVRENLKKNRLIKVLSNYEGTLKTLI